jgi:hypothetical protein
MEKFITLRWIEVDTILGDSLLAEAFGQDTMQAIKDKVIARLSIARAEGEKPLTAWLRSMAEENGLPVAVPAVPALRRAVEESAGAMRFVFWLA